MFAPIDSKFLTVGMDIKCVHSGAIDEGHYFAFKNAQGNILLVHPRNTSIANIVPSIKPGIKHVNPLEAAKTTIYSEDTLVEIAGWKAKFQNNSADQVLVWEDTVSKWQEIPFSRGAIEIGVAVINDEPTLIIASNTPGSVMELTLYANGVIKVIRVIGAYHRYRNYWFVNYAPNILTLTDTWGNWIDINVSNILSIEDTRIDSKYLVVRKEQRRWELQVDIGSEDYPAGNIFVRMSKTLSFGWLPGLDHYTYAELDRHIGVLMRGDLDRQLSRDVVSEVLRLLTRDLRDLFW